MALFNVRLNPNTAFSKALGFNPLGVVVQNYTPYWLYFPQADQYCPPWTDGWSTPLILNLNGYGYMQIQTPIGRTVQTNVTIGVAQFVNLTWTDAETAYYQGQSVDPGGAAASSSVVQNLSATVSSVVPYQTGLPPIPLLIGIPNKRYRILTINFFLMPFGGVPPVNYDSGVFVVIQSFAGLAVLDIAAARLVRDSPSYASEYPGGIDCLIQGDIVYSATADFASSAFRATITYQIIG